MNYIYLATILFVIGSATVLLRRNAIIVFMGIEKKWIGIEVSPLTKALLEQPAIWGVPFSLIVMVIGSKLTANKIPPDVDDKMLRLHAPEEMGISKNYVDEEHSH